MNIHDDISDVTDQHVSDIDAVGLTLTSIETNFTSLHDTVLYDSNGWNVSEWGWITTEGITGDSDTQQLNLGFPTNASIAKILKYTYVDLEKQKYHLGKAFTDYNRSDHGGVKFVPHIQARVLQLESVQNNYVIGSTPDATANKLAMRDPEGDCSFRVLRAFAVNTESSQVIRQDGHFLWLTEQNDGSRRSNGSWEDSSVMVDSVYRFGRDHQNLQLQEDDPGIWEFNSDQDGLHIEDNGQIATIHMNDVTPTLYLGGYKANSTVKIIECSMPALLLGEQGTDPVTVFSVSGSEVFCRSTLVCTNLKSTAGGGIFSTLSVKNLLTGGDSVWLGNRLHVTENGGAQLRLRSDTIPKYLQDLSPAVVIGDLSTSIEDVPLSEFISLSEARGGSSDLRMFYPYEANPVHFSSN